MTQMNMIQALNSAMDVMMARDPSVVLMGEDVGYFGGVFRATDGLQRKYGEHRVLDSPIAEGGIVATAIGMSVNGLRPVAEIQFADYIYPAYDQIVSELARIRYRSGGDFSAPVTIRTPCGGGIRGGQTHSQSPEALFAHVCGIKVVMPSNPYDAKGLLIAAIEDDDPVMFFEPKRLYNGPFDGDPNKPAVAWSSHPKGEVPEGHYRVPIGSAEIVRPGAQVTDRHLRHDGARVHRPRRQARHRCRNHRHPLDRAARRRDDLDVGEEDRPLRGRPRGDALRRLRRGDPVDDPGRMLLASGGADPARRRLGHAVSARVRVGILSRPGARRRRAQSNDGGVMSRHVVKLPDLGEGTVSSEIVAWHVKVGDSIAEDQPMVEMSTDKAVVEMPSPVSGRVVSLGGQPGDHIAVGAELIVHRTRRQVRRRDTSAPGASRRRRCSPPARRPRRSRTLQQRQGGAPAPAATAATKSAGRVMASPATRRRARESGIDLATIAGIGPRRAHSAPGSRCCDQRQGAWQGRQRSRPRVRRPDRSSHRKPKRSSIIGVRRVSAQRMAESKRTIPHFAYVEEVDMTELERLRKHLNSKLPKGTPGYTYLPFVAMALVRVIEQFPKCNSLYDAERNVLMQHRGVHVGIATQTSDGLKVPVVRHVEALSLREIAAEIRRVSEAARKGTATRNELRGSTITITSLGKLGGIVSTPIINAPEVAIIGVNKAIERPVVHQRRDRRAA